MYCWGKVKTSNPLWESRVKDALDETLQAKDGSKSLREAMSRQLQSGQRRINRSTTFFSGLGGGWRWRSFVGDTTTTVQNYQVGTLVVDLYDSTSEQLCSVALRPTPFPRIPSTTKGI
jgi:hypothetical protein